MCGGPRVQERHVTDVDPVGAADLRRDAAWWGRGAGVELPDGEESGVEVRGGGGEEDRWARHDGRVDGCGGECGWGGGSGWEGRGQGWGGV